MLNLDFKALCIRLTAKFMLQIGSDRHASSKYSKFFILSRLLLLFLQEETIFFLFLFSESKKVRTTSVKINYSAISKAFDCVGEMFENSHEKLNEASGGKNVASMRKVEWITKESLDKY